MYQGIEDVFAEFLNALTVLENNPKGVKDEDLEHASNALRVACGDIITVLTRSVDLSPEYTPESLIQQKWLVSTVLERVRAVIARVRLSITLIEKSALQKLFELGQGAQFIARQYFDASLSVYDETYPRLRYTLEVLKQFDFTLNALLDCLEVKRQFMLRQLEAKLKTAPQAV